MPRISYIWRKLRRALADGTLADKGRRRLITSLYLPFYIAQHYPALSQEDRARNVRRGFADHRNDAGTRKITKQTAERVIAAYRAAKRDQRHGPEALQVKGLWNEWLVLNYSALIAALEGSSSGNLVELLNNFEREDFAVGTGVSHQDLLRARHSLWGVPYIKSVWAEYRDKAASLGVDVAQASHPQIGNPAGLELGGSVMPVDSWRHVAKAREMAELLRDVPNSTILEIGGGFGSQAYQTVRAAAPRCYTIYDLPEVLAVSGAFLITALPEKKVALYGEPSAGADILVRPHFVIDEVADDSVDLFFNSNSFSEMDGESADYYLAIANRSCRRFFRHINHEERFTFRGPNGTSVNRTGSEIVPDPDRFTRIYKKPRLFGRPEDITYSSNDYLYERLPGAGR